MVTKHRTLYKTIPEQSQCFWNTCIGILENHSESLSFLFFPSRKKWGINNNKIDTRRKFTEITENTELI